MQDNRDNTKERFITLSPILDTPIGKNFGHGPAFAGEVPHDVYGIVGTEVPDKTFRKFPEREMRKRG